MQAADSGALAQNVAMQRTLTVVPPAEDEETPGLPGEVVMLLVGTMLMGIGGALKKRREDGGRSPHPATTRLGAQA